MRSWENPELDDDGRDHPALANDSDRWTDWGWPHQVALPIPVTEMAPEQKECDRDGTHD